jgi:hypothetical protein
MGEPLAEFQGGKFLSPLATLVTIVVSVVGAVLAGVAIITTQLSALDARLSVLDARLLRIETIATDRWLGSDMQNWAYQLERRNPDIKVPDPSQFVTASSRS